MAKQWTAEQVFGVAHGYQAASVLIAAAELDVFSVLAEGAKTAEAVAGEVHSDLRATTILLDALAAIELLVKDADRYEPAPGLADILTTTGKHNITPMLRHHGNCLRRWGQLAKVAMTGERAGRESSILGDAADIESFIEAMEVVSAPMADELVERLGPVEFRHMLDLGAGPATWTIAFLRAAGEQARATVYDLPEVIPIAKRHVEAADLIDRVTFAPGNFDVDQTLPGGVDLAWVSAIIHMNSRQENRSLFAKVFAALDSGGRILVRDEVMDPSRTTPVEGALFAVNMLVNTPGGNSYTLAEICEDLTEAGFTQPRLLCGGAFMDFVVAADRP